MTTKIKKPANLINWISGNKELRDESYSLTVKSIKLSNEQILELKTLLKKKEELESGPIVFENVKAKLLAATFLGHGEGAYYKDFSIPLGGIEVVKMNEFDKRKSFLDFSVEKLISSDPNNEYVDILNNLLCNSKACGASEQILESKKDKLKNWAKEVKILHNKFMAFLWKIEVPCWADWYELDTNTNLFVLPFSFEQDDSEFTHVWCNHKDDELLCALNILAEGKEVVFEMIEPFGEK